MGNDSTKVSDRMQTEDIMFTHGWHLKAQGHAASIWCNDAAIKDIQPV